MKEIGKLVEASIKDMWTNEPAFSCWLKKNPDQLGKALGMEPVDIQREVYVGSFKADLVFRDESTQKRIVVENMFNLTDHDHLGKLITYAAGLDAAYAVLISPTFREEHRSALMWLNSISANEFGFFGIALEAWRIGESPPAPRLRVEVKPDGWRRLVSATQDGRWSDLERLYYNFWDEFLPALREKHPDWSNRNPIPGNWITFSIGHSGFKIGTAFSQSRLRCDLYIETNTAAFESLRKRKEPVEEALGQSLEWDGMDGKKGARIALYSPEAIAVADEQKWPEAREWLIDAAGRMRQAFEPLIKDLPR